MSGSASVQVVAHLASSLLMKLWCVMNRPVDNLWTTRSSLRSKSVDNSGMLDLVVYAGAYKSEEIL